MTATLPPIPFAKGHGTGNDFVIIPDLDDRLGPGSDELGAGQVAAICHRRFGLGADGILRVTRTADSPEVRDQAAEAEWFMDYRNADGSVAEMCGNGARVFARFLISAGLAEPGTFSIATRGGVRAITAGESGDVTVSMGTAVAGGAALRVRADGGEWPAEAWWIPNPHAVTFVESVAGVGPLARPPRVSPGEVFPDGVNVEFVEVVAADRIRVRVHERGAGETLSCGTGACAAAVAAMRRAGSPAGTAPTGEVTVDVPGGRLQVRETGDGTVLLTGPAVLVASGSIDPDWLAAAAAAAVRAKVGA